MTALVDRETMGRLEWEGQVQRPRCLKQERADRGMGMIPPPPISETRGTEVDCAFNAQGQGWGRDRKHENITGTQFGPSLPRRCWIPLVNLLSTLETQFHPLENGSNNTDPTGLL